MIFSKDWGAEKQIVQVYPGTGPPLETQWPRPDHLAEDLDREGDYVYIACHLEEETDVRLQTVDVSGLPALEEIDLRTVVSSGRMEVTQVQAVGDRLYIRYSPWTDNTRLLDVFDIADGRPSHLYSVESDAPAGWWRSEWRELDFVALPDGYVYATDDTNHRIVICDCREGEPPGIVGEINLGPEPPLILGLYPYNVAIEGDLLFTDEYDEYGDHNLVAFDISDRLAPERLGSMLWSHYLSFFFNLRALPNGMLAFTRPGGITLLYAVDAREPAEMRIVADADVGTLFACYDADVFANLYFMHLGFADWPPFLEARAWYAYEIVPHEPYIMARGGGISEAHGWHGIVGGPLGTGGEVAMFTDPTGVQWAATVGWRAIMVLHRVGTAYDEWTRWDTGDERIVELPDSAGFDSADMSGDGRTLIVMGRRARDRHLFVWESTNKGKSWSGPSILTDLGP